MTSIGAIPLMIIGGVLGEIVGQLIFYRFKFGWKIVLSVISIGIVILIPAVSIIREMATTFYLPFSAPSTISVMFIVWILSRMYKRKKSTA